MPPLTLFVITPSTSSLVSKAFSIFFHVLIRLAFSRLTTISPDLNDSILSKYKSLPSIIFDEIGSGTSGDISMKIANLGI